MAIDLHWVGCDLVSGRIIEDLPALQPGQPLTSVLATYSSASPSLPIPLGGPGRPPPEWQSATQVARTMMVAVLAGQPVWAGIPVRMDSGTDPVASFGLVTLEGYLDRRYVGDHAWDQVDECSVIMAGLFADANIEGIGLVIDCPATGRLRDQTYHDYDDKTIYSALRSEMSADGGPEWTIALAWADAGQTTVSKIARSRSRIGVAAAVPSAVFDARSSASAVLDSQGAGSASYTVSLDYSAGRGANHIVAVSSGQGDSRPQSAPARSAELDAGLMPRWEHRWTPSTSITDVAVLDGHAAAALALMSGGARTVQVTARADAYPVLGSDWGLGDDIGYDLRGHGHPTGLQGTARAVGWQLDTQAETVAPMLLQPGLEVL